MDDNHCHASFLPITEKSKVQLARRGKTIYKFKIIQNEFLKQLLQNSNVNDIQVQIENIIDFILRTYSSDYPKESIVTADKFAVHIKTKPWVLSNILVFHNASGKYPAGETQFILTIESRSNSKLETSLHSQLHKDDATSLEEVSRLDKRSDETFTFLNVDNDSSKSSLANESIDQLPCCSKSVRIRRVKSQSDSLPAPVKISTTENSCHRLSKANNLKPLDGISHMQRKNQKDAKPGKVLTNVSTKRADRTISFWAALAFIFSLIVLFYLSMSGCTLWFHDGKNFSCKSFK